MTADTGTPPAVADRARVPGVTSIADLLDRLRHAPGVTVVVPVYNGGDAVATCLESLTRNTPNARLVVIDDASTDDATLDLLEAHARAGAVEVVRHHENRGYTRTANHALELAGADDVVLLNSDTEVGPLWLQRLRWAAYSQDRIASATAVSDNAGAMAVPLPGEPNTWPDHLLWDEVARGVARSVPTWTVPTPTANGFAMYLRREAVEEVGGFDVEAFPAGYGEENDWCLRAGSAEWDHVVAPRVMVRHSRSQSFGSRREALVAAGRAVLDQRYPGYGADVRAWRTGPAMAAVRTETSLARDGLAQTPRLLPRRLYVIHRSGGGTPATNRDLMGDLAGDQESYLLEALRHGIGADVFRWKDGVLEQVERFRTSRRFTLTDTWRQEYADFFAHVLLTHDIELVHVRHLINQPLTTAPRVAELLGIPMVLSTHDFYYVCPTIHLLDDQDRFCGGTCTPGNGNCRIPTAFVAGAPPLKHQWVHEWQRRSAGVLRSAAAVVATTRNAADVYRKTFATSSGPGSEDLLDKLHVIEHGRDLDVAWSPLRPDGKRRPGPLRMLVPANWAAHKGVDYIAELGRRLGPEVEWHVMGAKSELIPGSIGISHGEYDRETFRRFAAEIDPDVVGLFSIWAETYSHTLTEAWALGLPVVATDIGAVADRVRDHGGGLLVPIEDLDAATATIRELARDVPGVRARIGPVPRDRVRSSVTMAQDYRMLYTGIRPAGLPPVVGLVVPDGDVDSRTAVRIRHPRALERALWRRTKLADVVSGTDRTPYDAVLVPLGAVHAGVVEEVLAALAAGHTRLVVDVTAGSLDAAGSPDVADPAERTARDRLLAAADVVTLSSPDLADRVRAHAPDAVVVPDLLDPREVRLPEGETRPDVLSPEAARSWCDLVLGVGAFS